MTFFSYYHHSHPLRLSRWSFVRCSCKCCLKKYLDFHQGVTPRDGVTRGGWPPTSPPSDGTDCGMRWWSIRIRWPRQRSLLSLRVFLMPRCPVFALSSSFVTLSFQETHTHTHIYIYLITHLFVKDCYIGAPGKRASFWRATLGSRKVQFTAREELSSILPRCRDDRKQEKRWHRCSCKSSLMYTELAD